MRLHFIVLVVVLGFLFFADGHPISKRSEEEEQDEGPVADDVSNEDKKDEVEDVPEEQDESADKKTRISVGKEEKEDVAESEEINDKKAASDIKEAEAHQMEEEEDEAAEDVASKKDTVKSADKKDDEEEEAEANESVASTPAKKSSTKHHDHEHTHGDAKHNVPVVAKKTVAAKKSEENAKKWWMVGDHPDWGGRGHGHWGPPSHDAHGGHDYEGHGGRHYKSHVARCCKHKDKNVRKRCECAHHEDPHHLEGYHFHEHGHGGHNDHDHDLKGPWAFGYDGFGDDWNDWDHNHGNYEHLQKLDRESHEGHHGDDYGHHGDCEKRNCVQLSAETLPGTQITAETLGQAVVTPAGGPLVGPGPSPVIGPAPGPVIEPAGAPVLGGGLAVDGLGAGLSAGPGLIAPMAAPVAGAAPLGMPVVALPEAPAHLPYRVCHDCHLLKNGGSRCLCKAIKHPVHHANTHYDHHVYIDCDAAVHNYPEGNHLCYPRGSIPTPENEKHTGGKAKQGVVYPYVGYGPWSAYPWWGDWWGGHGNHGWGGQNGGCEHGCGGGGGGGCDHGGCDHGAAGCDHGCAHPDHAVDVDHGEALVHHEHNDHGCDHGCDHGDHGHCRPSCGHEVGFSLGHHGGPAGLHAYRCHDVIENNVAENPGEKSKRFCVPVGYHGGYGWPYWHGYPGVGTGLWGWGWPWIKNRVPGSKMKEGQNKTSSAAGDKAAAAAPAAAPSKDIHKRSYVDENSKNNITKKQTIHVGYGYASGDNYRLGYGYGGMGGVAGFAPGANAIGESGSQNPFSRSKIETQEDNALPYTKNNIPKPAKAITVTGTKRDIEKVDNSDGYTSNRKM